MREPEEEQGVRPTEEVPRSSERSRFHQRTGRQGAALLPTQKYASGPLALPSFRPADEKNPLKLRFWSLRRKNAEDFDFLAEAAVAHRAQRHCAACGRLERPVVPFSVSEPCPYGALHQALGSTLKLAWQQMRDGSQKEGWVTISRHPPLFTLLGACQCVLLRRKRGGRRNDPRTLLHRRGPLRCAGAGCTSRRARNEREHRS